MSMAVWGAWAGLAAAWGGLWIRYRRLAREREKVVRQLEQDSVERRAAFDLIRLQRDLAVEMGEKGSLDDALHALLARLCAVPGVDAGGVYLATEQGGLDLAASRNLSERFLSEVSRLAPTEERVKAIMGGRLFSRDYASLSPDSLMEGLRFVLTVPVRHQGRVVAVLNLASRTMPVFHSSMVAAVEAVAEHIGGLVSRVRAEEALKEREHCFRNLAESAFDGIAVLGADRRFLYANPQFVELTGYAFSELAGLEFEKLLSPDLADTLRARFEDRMKGLPVPTRFEAIYRRRDGSSLPVRLSARRIAWHGKPAVLAYVQDQTEKAHVDATHRELKHILNVLFDLTPSTLILLDEESRIVRINLAGMEMVGGDVESLRGLRPGELLNCLNSHDHEDGCGFGPHCPICDMRQNLESVLKVQGSVRGAQATMTLLRENAHWKVRFLISAEPLVREGRRHVLIALEELGAEPLPAG